MADQQSAGLSTATATQTILTRIQEMNTTVQGWGLDKVLPLGTSDAGSLMSTTLASGIDYFHANGESVLWRLLGGLWLICYVIVHP